MQFIKNGPDIPERLLQAHEDGRVVFFCGAGISYPAGLPGFAGLVNKLYDGVGVTPSATQQAATNARQYDTAIGLLEADTVGGREVVRRELMRILQPNLSKPRATATHEALLALARNREGRYRLITTNFDRLFEEVIERQGIDLPTYQAPLLPVPKNRWDGIVYLHGLLPKVLETGSTKPGDLDHLVLSSGDFGLAYLIERWAARFVSELFRSHIVCFVGYSISDPVLRYMMDALAADRLLGEEPHEVFAFGSFSRGKEDKAANEWKAKNVIPLLYPEHHHHAYLHRTLQEWAMTYRDGALGKEHIVTQHAVNKPSASTTQDDFVGRVLWALSDSKGLPAKRFAELDLLPPLDWLEPLAEARFGHGDLIRFGIQPDTKQRNDNLAFSLLRHPASYTHAPPMALVRHGHDTGSLDPVMFHLARWLTRHLNNPKLILWVAKQGGVLHPQLSQLIAHTLENEEFLLRPPMRALWRVALAGRLESPETRGGLYTWRKRMKRDGLSFALRLQLRDLLSPRVRLSEPLRLGQEKDKNGTTRISDLVNWEIALNTNYALSTLKKMAQDAQWQDALPELLSDATALLHDALDLRRELDGADDEHDMSYMERPSISESSQNLDFRDWTALISLARDAWLATAEKAPDRARLEVERWLSIPYPLFRRLAFFVAADTHLVEPRQALNWLLDNEHWWLWSVETEREALRLLVFLAPQLKTEGRKALENAILQGPPRRMFRDDIEPERLQFLVDRETWLRLAKLKEAGAKLGADAATRLRILSEQNPMWWLAKDERDEFPVWMSSDGGGRAFLATPRHYPDLVDWLREHPSGNVWDPDGWRERCKRDFRRAAVALIRLARQDEWLVDRWREALQVWTDEQLVARSWCYVSNVLAEAPDNIAKGVASSLTLWLEVVAKTFGSNETAFFTLIRRVMTLHCGEVIEPDNDPVFKAINHPVGRATEAALNWWHRQSLEDGQGLPDVLKPIFTELCNTEVEGFRHGRVLLATHVISLFRVDREWTTRYLLPLFDWQRSVDEARAAWEGFLWAPRLYRPLMEALKPYFLVTAQHYADLGQHGRQYAALLTFAALEAGDTFSKRELANATRSLPPEGLQQAVWALTRALDSAGEQCVEYWRNRVSPYLKSIWPKSLGVKTPDISQRMAELCIAAGDAFPEAFRELRPWVQSQLFNQTADLVVYLFHEANLCQPFPEDALAFLEAVVDANAQWPPHNLKDCLESIREARQELEEDDRFKKLYEYLRESGEVLGDINYGR